MPIVDDEFRRVEVGYLGGAAVLCALLYVIYRRPRPRSEDTIEPGSTEEIELRLAAADEGELGAPRIGRRRLRADPRRGRAAGAGIGAALIADRVKVPGLLLFLGLGMLVGSEGIGGVEFDDAELTRTLGTIGLILILFEGGLTAGWREIRPVLRTAISLGTVGTIVTAVIAGFAAAWIFDLGTLEGLIIGSAIAATDSAAIFAVLRGSNLRRKIARSLEGESGMNDPVALLLVTGLHRLDRGARLRRRRHGGRAGAEAGPGRRRSGSPSGSAPARTFRRLNYPTAGLYPVASIATAALAYGVAEVAARLGLPRRLPGGAGPRDRAGARASAPIVAFHQGLGWVSQIALFFLLGLLVFPSGLVEVAAEGLLLSAVLIFVARPLAALVASLPARSRCASG